MSDDAPLPADLSKWPTDPYTLIGITRSADAKEAKRAYLKLARLYKPEHEPEKFKRLRMAFEQVQRQIELRERFSVQWKDDEVELQAERKTLEIDDAIHATWEASSRQSAMPAAASEVQRLWSAAGRGEEAQAYVGLQEQRHLSHSSSDVYARLYWLLAANGTLDPRRVPCDWLVEGLRKCHLNGPLRELYRREMAANPYEAVGTRCASLLETQASTGALADLLEWRWRGASLLGRWDLILDDLRTTRPKIVFDDEETWGRLLLLVIDYLVWLESREAGPVLDKCRRELDDLAHLHARLGDDYDRLDLLFDVVAGWHRLRFATDVPSAWTSLLPLSWNQSPEALRQRFAPFLKNLAERPTQALRTFDALARHSKAAAAHLGQSIERLRNFENPYDDRRDSEAITALVRRFARWTRASYATCRERLLQLCLREAIDPLWVGSIVDALPREQRYDDDSWTDAITSDGPLRYVYLGYRAYWG